MGYSGYALLLSVCLCWVLTTFTTGDEAASPLVISPHCSAKCGNLSIPYPFGIEEGCYYKPPDNEISSSFKINCSNATNPPTPILLEMELLNISVVEGELRAKSPVSYDCYNQTSRYSWFERFNLGTFTLSSLKNILVAIGCDTASSFSGFRVGLFYKTGCSTNCVQPGDVINGECSGVGCCQTSIPLGVNNITVQVESPSNRSSVNGFNPCNVAFPVAKDGFKFNEKYLGQAMEYYQALAKPVVFNWTVGRDNCSVEKADGSCLCKENTECYDPMRELGYRCRCKDGYSGNPCHPLGCTDIDECKDANDCEKSEYCINTIGSYHCKCPRGYHGKGTKTNICISNRKPWPTPVLATAGLSVIFGLTLLLLFGCWLHSVSKKRKVIKQQKINFERNGGLLLQQEMSSYEGIVERIKIFTINELEKSTDHFSEDRILGQGGHGTVYKGMLSEGRIVAIKKSNKLEEGQREEFINEVVIMSQINHRNILKLLGCCLETDVPLLVYEFIPNGTLYHHIHNPNDEFPITWKMRLHIASDSAGALTYLHSSTSNLIFHRDIKSSNILLDDKYRAKLSDFGFSRSVAIDQTHVVTRVMGTPGYLDPEYFQSHQYTEKSDVYSFGVVLVELLTGQKAVRAAFEEDRSLISWFLSHVENSCVLNIIDSQVLLEGSEEEFLAIANLAKQCLILDGKRRPTMKEVWLEIDRILSLHVPHINDLNKPKPEQVFVRASKSANSSTFSLESRVLDSTELSLLFNPR